MLNGNDFNLTRKTLNAAAECWCLNISVRILTHFRFVFECVITTVTNAVEVCGALTSKATEISSTFFGCSESLESNESFFGVERKTSEMNTLEKYIFLHEMLIYPEFKCFLHSGEIPSGKNKLLTVNSIVYSRMKSEMPQISHFSSESHSTMIESS